MDIVIIPSLNPNEKLIKIINELLDNKIKNIIVVDDGSDSKEIFNKLSKDVLVLHHKENRGKGAAIKTAVKYASENFKHINGYIFMDSDGQHSTKDVIRVIKEMNTQNSIIFGVRDFSEPNVPKKSKWGNKISSWYYKLLTGINMPDTQTGLRAIPYRYTKILLNTQGDRYEYEMNFLNYIGLNHIPFKTIKINTIYEDNNSVSHFNAVKDSIRIFKEPLKYLIIALTSFIIDVLMFILYGNLVTSTFMANVLARVTSGLYNYNMNKYWCFKSYQGSNQFLKYLILFITQMLISSTLVNLFSGNTLLVMIKMVIDLVIFTVNYFIQKKYIFKGATYEEI